MVIKSGDTVGDYKVIDLAGSGGMGAVYKIEHVITKRIEAMKVLPIGIGSGPEEVQRFEREIQVQARLHHPNIAAVYNAVRDAGSIALIMEYVEGQSMQQMLEGGRLPLRTAVDYACQVLNALAYSHGEGVVHRDVTPANIIITPEGVAKLTDFGLARAITDLHLTATGVAVGSAWYMSPEQVKAVDELDPRTDIYSTGAVLHEMLTGRKLFDADGSFAVMSAQVEVIPQPPSAYNSEVPKALDEVVAKALAKDPAARFQNAEEFRLGLEAAVVGLRSFADVPNAKRAPQSTRRARGLAVLVLVPATMVAATCSVLLWPTSSRIPTHQRAPQAAMASKPEAVPAPAPPPPAVDPAPAVEAPAVEIRDVPVATAKPAPRPASSHAYSVRRAPEPDLKTVIRSYRAVPEPPSAPPRLNPASKVEVTPPATAAAKPDAVASSEAAPAPTVPDASAEPESTTQTPEEATPPKNGSRLRRVLGKLNPFSKGAKKDSAVPDKTVGKQFPN